MAEEWLIRPPISLATAMPRFATPATITVPVDSLPVSDSGAPDTSASFIRACSRLGAGSVMAAAMPRTAAAHAARRRDVARPPAGSADAEEVDDEDQRLPRLDHPAGAALAVGLVRRDGQPPAAADPHPRDPLVPPLDDHADAQSELQRVAAVPGGVELLAAAVRDADVVRAHQAARGRLRPLAD